MQKLVVITGGCGFVGRHFCKRFHDLGYTVICVDNMCSSSAKYPDKWMPHLKIDDDDSRFIFIETDCREYFKHHSYHGYFDIVVHLAAVVEGRDAIENSPLLIAEDLSIDAMFFKWLSLLSQKPGKVVYFSSSAAYPIKYQRDDEMMTILHENMIDLNSDTLEIPDLTYGWAKLTGEYLAKLAHEKHGIDIVCYRPFSGFDVDQAMSYPFPSILQKCMSNPEEVEIWSDSVRDFVSIEECIDCVLATKDKICDGTALNIGTGRAISFSELVKVMTDGKGKVKVLDDKPKGVYYRVADTTKTEKYGWKSQVTLEENIKRIKSQLLENAV